MPRIIEIAGTMPRISDIQSELKDRAKLVKPAPFYDTSAMTEGEMNLYLLAQRAKMYSEYFPENQQLRKAYENYRDVLYKGLHTGVGLSNLRQRTAINPASGWLSWEDKNVNFSRDYRGIKNLFEDAPEGVGIRGIPSLDCNTLYPNTPPAGIPQSALAVWATEQDRKRQACINENWWRSLLNNKFKAVGHHPLYSFITNPNAQPGTVNTKTTLHTNAIYGLNTISKISFNNLHAWQENDIINENMTKAVGPLNALETIAFLKLSVTEDIKIGFLDPATVSALVILGKILVAAIVAASGLILAIKGKDQSAAQTFEYMAQGWGGGSDNVNTGKGYGPYKTDWETDGGGSGSGGNTGGGGGNNGGGGGGNNGGGGGFSLDNLSQTQKLGLGVAAAGLVYALTKK